MQLIFINHVGKSFKGDFLYEFLFTSSKEIFATEGDDWDSTPCNGSPKSPVDFVEEAYSITLNFELELVQNSVNFNMTDCKQQIIPLAWEVDSIETYFYDRMLFRYGEKFSDVEAKLYKRDLSLEKTYSH